MAFLQDRTNRNFSTSKVHKFLRFDSEGDQLLAVVNSYATLEAFKSANQFLNWQDIFKIPATAAAQPEVWLISDIGPFAGATVLEESTPLDESRSLRWAGIKSMRDFYESSPFIYQGRSFNANAVSVQRILLAAQSASAKLAAGEPGVVDWTTADNEVVTLSSQEIVELAQALNSHIESVHETAKTLRIQLYAASTDTVEKIQAIQWPL